MLNDAAIAAGDADDEASAALAWEGAFSFLMPLPEPDEVEVIEASTERALMQVPDVDVAVYDHRGGTLLTTYRNEVPSVPRARWLVFSIVNRHIVPNHADISWTVRNDGEEANHIGDLGHIQRGIGMFSAEEGTSYLGKHYMDCVVRCNGSVFCGSTRTGLHQARPAEASGSGTAGVGQAQDTKGTPALGQKRRGLQGRYAMSTCLPSRRGYCAEVLTWRRK